MFSKAVARVLAMLREDQRSRSEHRPRVLRYTCHQDCFDTCSMLSTSNKF
ncbi:hypothetical protein Hanom_Chr14g01268091 [Helianthus anomalus]